MGVLGSIFGSDKAIKAARDGLDAVVFTPEERSRYFLEVLRAYHPFRRAQRVLAFTLFFTYMPIVIYAVVVYSIGLAGNDQRLMDAAFDIVSIGNMGQAFVMVMAFYFGGGVIESFKRAK